MEWLNYHHLLYFWMVARTGGIARAGQELRLAAPTISTQIKMLEDSIGEKLLERSGRKLVLTDVGRVVFRYAEEIFALGDELKDTLKGRPTGKPAQLRVGVADVLPKIIAYMLIEPAMHGAQPIQLICREDPIDRLLPALAAHDVDVLLSDTPIGPGSSIRAFNHLLGECDIAFYAKAPLGSALRRGFPKSLDGAPFLLPTQHTALRPNLNQWFAAQQIKPRIVAEFDDFSLLRVFTTAGHGVCAAPVVLDAELRRVHRLQRIGQAENLRARFYAISVDRRISQPAVVAICERARAKLFG